MFFRIVNTCCNKIRIFFVVALFSLFSFRVNFYGVKIYISILAGHPASLGLHRSADFIVASKLMKATAIKFNN